MHITKTDNVYIATALECYHCDEAVRNVTDCNTTQACNEGEVGILYAKIELNITA